MPKIWTFACIVSKVKIEIFHEKTFAKLVKRLALKFFQFLHGDLFFRNMPTASKKSLFRAQLNSGCAEHTTLLEKNRYVK